MAKWLSTGWWAIAFLAGPARAESVAAPAGRETGNFYEIECEYSTGQEDLARLLAERFAAHNREVLAHKSIKKSELVNAAVPLSPGELRQNRAVYLGRIAMMLGLDRVTPRQEECYDAFLENYQLTMDLYAYVGEAAAEAQVISRVTIWPREELIRRLGAGEAIAGFSFNPVTKQGDAKFALKPLPADDRFKDLAAKRAALQSSYRFSIDEENGQLVYRASVSPRPRARAAAAVDAPPEVKSEYFPVVIPAEFAGLPATELAPKLWDGAGGRSVAANLGAMAGLQANLPVTDPTIGFLVLHETTEVGIVDHYFRGPDRRWFCDGVANYVPWRVVRDLQGEAVANRVYNLAKDLAQWAAWREKADLRKWPATENQTEEDQHSDLNRARYAFAANAVFLMNARAGEDVLPRLFAEIGRTKPSKVSIKVVEKAWSKVTGTPLGPILAAAVQAPPAAPAGGAR